MHLVFRTAFTALFGLVSIFHIATIDTAQAGGHVPECENPRVLKKLVKRFNQTERIYWNDRGLVLSDVSRPHHHSSYTPEDSEIDRRYCHGTAVFDNGKHRKVHYLIEEKAGFAGFGWNVEYCIHGLDQWKYYDGRCRVLSK